MNLIETITIQGFWASSNSLLSEKFIEGHVEVLKQHGFNHFVTKEDYWVNSNFCYVLLASIGSEYVGGLRIELKEDDKLLPTEKVLKMLNKEKELSIKLEAKKSAEICGLWNSKRVAGQNLSIHLSRASAAIAPLIGIDLLLCFNATYTFRIPKDTGCRMITNLGNDGYINYPSDKFRAALWVQEDLDNFSLASQYCKDAAKRIRDERNVTFNNKYREHVVSIKYEIEI